MAFGNHDERERMEDKHKTKNVGHVGCLCLHTYEVFECVHICNIGALMIMMTW